MTKDQERSFIARITYDGVDMTFFDQILSSNRFVFDGKSSPAPPNIVTTFEAYNPVTREMVHVGRKRTTTMVIHFQCYGDYYNLQILSEAYYKKYFSKGEQGVLGAYPAAGGDTTSFNLLNASHDIITLDDLSDDNPSIYLKARNAGIIRKDIWREPAYSSCFTDTSGKIVAFKLDILERQAASPQHPTPYS